MTSEGIEPIDTLSSSDGVGTTDGTAEYRALMMRLADVDKIPCTDDPRFILDRQEVTRDELEHIGATICAHCPVRELCAAYGDAARPPAGIWAGTNYATWQPHARRRTR